MIAEQNQKISNVPEFSVTELAGSLKRTIEDTYGRVRVRGELSRVSIAGSGHMYSSLKDEASVIDAVCWKGSMAKLSVQPEEGLEVICTGRLTTYPKSSKYQLVIESMELAGEGALLKMLEQRKKMLAAEGLFAEERKKPLPFLPEVIGVVTSPTGAVIRDILHRLEDRFPRHVLVWPVLVQGEGAAEQVARAIEGFDAMTPGGAVPRPDLLIVARGGGSLEDLMAFNEEVVVRAAANCSIPLISAVGHETDTTLIDFASDLRAPTPTGAAEKAVPRRADLLAYVLESQQRIMQAMNRRCQDLSVRLEGLQARLGDPSRLMEVKAQRLDHLSSRMSGVFTQYLHVKERGLQRASADLTHPRYVIRQAEAALKSVSGQLERAGTRLLSDPETRLATAGRMLESLSFKRVLDRGFAVVRDEKGALVNGAAALKAGDSIQIEFKQDQKIDAFVGKSGRTGVKTSKPKKGPTEQQSLF